MDQLITAILFEAQRDNSGYSGTCWPAAATWEGYRFLADQSDSHFPLLTSQLKEIGPRREISEVGHKPKLADAHLCGKM